MFFSNQLDAGRKSKLALDLRESRDAESVSGHERAIPKAAGKAPV